MGGARIPEDPPGQRRAVAADAFTQLTSSTTRLFGTGCPGGAWMVPPAVRWNDPVTNEAWSEIGNVDQIGDLPGVGVAVPRIFA